MKWLTYIAQPNVPEAYPSYHKGEVTPVMKWNEYGSHIKEKGTEKFWHTKSKIDPVMGTYGCYLIRLLKANFTFGWDVNFDNYDGIIVGGDLKSNMYLRQRY